MQAELVTKAQAGDRDAFSALASAAATSLYATARLILRHPDRAEDAVQDVVRRQREFLFRDAHLTNPATGRTLFYSQDNTDNDVLGVPGDLGSATTSSHGHLTITAPGFGTVILEGGQGIFGPDGTVEFRGGPFELSRYYAGELEIVDDLCAAMGTPNG